MVHQEFEAQARRTPDSVAASDENQGLTYRQLNARANQLGRYLKKSGVGPETLVGVAMGRSVELMVALLGILKAGGAYLPLDLEYPPERLAFMAQDAGVLFVLTQEKLSPRIPGRPLCLDSLLNLISQESEEDFPSGAGPGSLAYAIYTSGSTGQPKAALIEHHSLANILGSLRVRPGISARDTMLASTTLSFDMAAVELFLPLIVGGRVFVAGQSLFKDAEGFRAGVEKSGATILQGTPSFFRLLIETGWMGGSGLRLFCGGEALRETLAGELLKRGSTLWNLYGPTEATVYATGFQVTKAQSPLCIGTPFPNTQAYILDDRLESLPTGGVGELYIGGEGLARGYLNRPELTAERFISGRPGARLYRTGDLARCLPDGNIEFLGRADDQVKLRGFRIEPGEIEAALAQCPGVEAAVAVAREDIPGDIRLVAYVVRRTGGSPSAEDLRVHLKSKLPEHMLPSRFEFLDSIPLTPSGKADRRALPAPGVSREPAAHGSVEPRTGLEKKLSRLFAEVLKLDRVGVDESFFDLGGNSLLSLDLLARIEKALDWTVPHAALFAAPNVEGLAAFLEGGAQAPAVPGVLPLQPLGPLPPFFGVGSGPDARFLARRLGSDQPFVGVVLEETDLQALPAPFKVEDIAAVFVGKIRKIRPRGPYFLGNGCAPVFIAYEVAQQLQAAGEAVPLLALMSFANPSHIPRYVKERREEFIRRRMRFALEHLRAVEGARDKAAYVFARLFDRLEQAAAKLGSFFFRRRVRWGLPVGRNMRHVNLILDSALRDYRPRRYAGRAALIRREPLPGEPYQDDDDLGWSELVDGRLDVHSVPCPWGRDMFMEPEVRTTAIRLKGAIQAST